MRIIVAPDSFKGSLSSQRIIEIVSEQALLAYPHAQITGLPVADGGEGTVDALLACVGGEKRRVRVAGPLFDPVDAFYGVLPSGAAVVESAAACGLPLVPEGQRNPLNTTSLGVGELIAAALNDGASEIYIGLGGSATVDGGLGALSALGVRFLDAQGDPVPPTGAGAGLVREIDASGMLMAAKGARLSLLLDVNNPLTGPNGAAHIFGPQKGATPDMVNELEDNLASLARVAHNMGADMDAQRGAGAAGGLGGALNAFLGAQMRSGIDAILDLMDFDRQLDGCSLVITGEGRVDGQSAGGKAVSGIAARAKAAGVPAIALAGGIGPGAEQLRSPGELELMPIAQGPMSLQESMEDAQRLLRDAAARLFGLLSIGRRLA